MKDIALKLKDIAKVNDYLIGVDSDGCVFDTMEIKHKECFIPNIIKYWNLQPISKYARETAEFVNLYSKWRGMNRFPALLMVFDLLSQRKEISERKFKLPEVSSLRQWCKEENKLCDASLEKAVEESHDPILDKTLNWSKAVNKTIESMVRGIPPFSNSISSLQKASNSDIIVVSATPCEALEREWIEHGIDVYVKVIAGQEMGTKKEHLNVAIGNCYAPNHTLMIGDALGDYEAAKFNNCLFYPIIPGHEDESWQRFREEAYELFVEGKFGIS